MWHSQTYLELSYAYIDFHTHTIVWKDKGFTPKRRKALLASLVARTVEPDRLEKIA